jgi:glycosyltransferase involved in cell wall biosynthesis
MPPNMSGTQLVAPLKPPRVCCLTVTQPGRAAFLTRAIGDFLRQEYAPKSMLILHDGDEKWHQECETMIALSGAHAAGEIALHRVAPGLPLGELRNRSVELATGHFVCQWDDDDRSHPLRLSAQVAALMATDATACYLEQQIHRFADTGEWYVEDWSRQPYPRNVVQGSALVRREAMPRYPAQSRGEDTALLHALIERAAVIARVQDQPWLYCYSFHGGNTFDRAHHAAIARDTQVTPAAMLNLRNRLENEITKYSPPVGS